MPSDRLLDTYVAQRQALLAYARRLTGDAAQAEDVLQEAYLRVRKVSERDIQDPLAYLYRIVRNLAFDGLKYVRRDQPRHEDEALVERAADDRPSPEAVAAGRADLAALTRAINELPERTRIALEMHRLGEHRLKDIADHLGISVGLAHKLVSDGLEHCRQRLYRRQ